MAEPTSRSASRCALLALFLSIIGAGSMVYYHEGFLVPTVITVRAARGMGGGYSFGDDFYPVWLVARQWRLDHLDPYSTAMTRKIQEGLFGRALVAHNSEGLSTNYRQFAYPAFTELLFWPAAAVSFPTLRIVLAIVLPVLSAFSVWLWTRALGWRLAPCWTAALILLALCNYQVLEGFFAEQPGLFVGFFLAWAAVALRTRRLLTAGVLMALTTMKPQMSAVVIAYLLLWSLFRRDGFRFWVGFGGTMAFLMVGSLWLWPHWLQAWIGLLLGYHDYATPPLLELLAGPRLGPYVGPAGTVALLAIAAWIAWRNRRAAAESLDFWWAVALLFAITSVTLLPGQAVYDDVILFPAIFLMLMAWSDLWQANRTMRVLLVVGAITLLWPWVTASVLLAARPLMSPLSFYSNEALSLPIRTAASIPFAVLAVMGYGMRVRKTMNRATV